MRCPALAPVLAAFLLAALGVAFACRGGVSVEEYRGDLTSGLDEFVAANAALVQAGFPEGDRAGYEAFFERYRDNFDRLHDDLKATDAPDDLGDEHDAFTGAVAAVSDRVDTILGRDLGGAIGTEEALLLARLYNDLEAAESACTALDGVLRDEDGGPALPCTDFGRFASASG